MVQLKLNFDGVERVTKIFMGRDGVTKFCTRRDGAIQILTGETDRDSKNFDGVVQQQV